MKMTAATCVLPSTVWSFEGLAKYKGAMLINAPFVRVFAFREMSMSDMAEEIQTNTFTYWTDFEVTIPHMKNGANELVRRIWAGDLLIYDFEPLGDYDITIKDSEIRFKDFELTFHGNRVPDIRVELLTTEDSIFSPAPIDVL